MQDTIAQAPAGADLTKLLASKLPSVDETTEQASQLLAVPPPRLSLPGAEEQDAKEGDENDEETGGPDTPSNEPLTAEAISNVVKQIEFYFSDASLPTDKKLLKQIRKDPDGFVPVKMFANFRKVRAITRDPDVISEALQTSKELLLSADGKQVRRIIPVPEYDIEDIQTRTVVVENLPLGSTIESVTKLMKQYGSVKLVRICNRETKGKLPVWLTSSLGSVVLKSSDSMNGGLRSQHSLNPTMSEKPPHAYVEYETEDEAVMAVAALHDTEGWRPLGINVHHLIYECSDTPKQPRLDPRISRANSLAPRHSGRDLAGGPRHSSGLTSTMSERTPSNSSWRAPLVQNQGGAWGASKARDSTNTNSSGASAGSPGANRSRLGSIESTGLATHHFVAYASPDKQPSVATAGSPGSGSVSPRKGAYVPPALRGADSVAAGKGAYSGNGSPTQPGSPLRGASDKQLPPGSPLKNNSVRTGALFANEDVTAAAVNLPASPLLSPPKLQSSGSSSLRCDAPEYQPKGPSSPTAQPAGSMPPAGATVPASPFETPGLRSQLVIPSFTGMSVFGKQAAMQAQIQSTFRSAGSDKAAQQTGTNTATAASKDTVLNPSQLSLRPIKTVPTGSAASDTGSPAGAASATAGSPAKAASPASAKGSPLQHAAVTAAQQSSQLGERRSSGSAPKFVLDFPPGNQQPVASITAANNSNSGKSRAGSSGNASPAALTSQLKAFGSLMEPSNASFVQPQFPAVGPGNNPGPNPFVVNQDIAEMTKFINALIPGGSSEPVLGPIAAAAAATSQQAEPIKAVRDTAGKSGTDGELDLQKEAAKGQNVSVGGKPPRPSVGGPGAPSSGGLVSRLSGPSVPSGNEGSKATTAGDKALKSHSSFPGSRASSTGEAEGARGQSPGSDHESDDDPAANAGDSGANTPGGGKRRRRRGSRGGASRSRRASASSAHANTGPALEGAPITTPVGSVPNSHGFGSFEDGSGATPPERGHQHLAHRPSGHKGQHGGLKKDAGGISGSDSASASGGQHKEAKARRNSKPDYASWAAATPEYRAESARLAHGGADTPPRSPRRNSNLASNLGAADGAGSGAATPTHHHASQQQQQGLVVVAQGPDGTKGFGGRGRGQPLAPPPP